MSRCTSSTSTRFLVSSIAKRSSKRLTRSLKCLISCQTLPDWTSSAEGTRAGLQGEPGSEPMKLETGDMASSAASVSWTSSTAIVTGFEASGGGTGGLLAET